jgi:hypothetical protein
MSLTSRGERLSLGGESQRPRGGSLRLRGGSFARFGHKRSELLSSGYHEELQESKKFKLKLDAVT